MFALTLQAAAAATISWTPDRDYTLAGFVSSITVYLTTTPGLASTDYTNPGASNSIGRRDFLGFRFSSSSAGAAQPPDLAIKLIKGQTLFLIFTGAGSTTLYLT